MNTNFDTVTCMQMKFVQLLRFSEIISFIYLGKEAFLIPEVMFRRRGERRGGGGGRARRGGGGRNRHECTHTH